MRHLIDLVTNLNEDVVSLYPERQTASNPHQFSLLVLGNTDQGDGQLHLQKVDHLDGLTTEEVAAQIKNYDPVAQHDNTWQSAPMAQRDGAKVTYYMRVFLNQNTPPPDVIQLITQELNSSDAGQ